MSRTAHLDVNERPRYREPVQGELQLIVDIDGFEGPLDLLLHMARGQKVDLTKISILALVEQYLEFINQVRELRLDLAADYLVMAAWLAYLKSRLMIPQVEEEDTESAEEMAARLQFRLQKLEAMREAGQLLVNRAQLGRDRFVRGVSEFVQLETKPAYTATLYDLLTAYANQRQRRAVRKIAFAKRSVWSLGEAKQALTRLIGEISGWTELDAFLCKYLNLTPAEHRSALASSFAAGLELAREGQAELRQSEAFSPLMIRHRTQNRPSE